MHRSILLALLLIFSFHNLLAAEKVYLPFFSCENCSKEVGRSATFMLADYINNYNSFETIIAQKRDTTLFEESLNEIKESAELLGTSYYILGTISRLDKTYHISVTLYAASNNMIIWKGLRTVTDLNDIPIVLDQFASDLGSDKDFSQPGDVFRVSSQDSKRITREKSNKSIGLIVGAMLPLSNEEIENVNGGFGLLGSFDTRNFILQLSAEIYYGNDSVPSPLNHRTYENRYFNIGANVLYPLSKTNSAPFVSLGSGFTYRDTKIKSESVFRPTNNLQDKDVFDSGLFFNGGGGYILKRKSDATMFIYARGYVYIPDINNIVYGAMLNFAITIGG